MGPEHGNSDPREMKSIRQEDERKSGNVMDREFEKVFAWFLELEGQYDEEMGPIGCLKEIECLEYCRMSEMRVIDVELLGIKWPHWRL